MSGGWVVRCGALLLVDGDGASRFGPGRGRPWGRVAWLSLAGKVKSSEWRIFGGERLLGASNGNEPKRRIHGIKRQSREGEECAARGKESRLCQVKILQEAAREKAKTHV